MSTFISEDEEAILIEEFEEIERVITNLSTSNSEFERELAGLSEENKELKTTVETVLKELMQRNIIIRGLPDSASETGQKLLQTVKKIIFTITKKKEIKIDTVQRIGQFELGYTRQVRVIFCTIRERNTVFNCRVDTPIKYVIQADTPSRIMKEVDGVCQVEANMINIDVKYLGFGIEFPAEFELNMEDIVIDHTRVIGTGVFATGYYGTAKEVQVAVSVPNKFADRSSFRCLLNSIKLQSYLGTHPNIVALVGAFVKHIFQGKLVVAYELCTNGNLQEYLRKKSQVSNGPNDFNNLHISHKQVETIDFYDLLRFAFEIAKALEYIEKYNVIHGDVETRNVFLNSNLTCKLGDFGLSRRLYEHETYVKKSQDPMPCKWMAYESLVRMEFSSKSDVWSFGVAVWEIFSLGNGVLYKGNGWTPTFVDDIRNGMILPMPEFGTEEIYNKLKDCWNLEKDLRPQIGEMVGFFTPLGYRAKSTEDYAYI